MKHLCSLLTIVFTYTLVFAQSSLTFNKRIVESEDQWVAFKQSEEGNYPYGFVYIDSQAELTLNYEGTFKISDDGKFIPSKLENSNTKVRLQPNNVLLAFIPKSKFTELQIEAIPNWLKHYKTDEDSIERLYKWGFMYNGWGECEKALTFLKQANAIDPSYEGLAVELAYSYNCLKQYDFAEEILKEDLKINASNSYVNKEYIYTLTKNDKIDKAISQYNSAKNLVDDKKYDAENCYNILQYFYFKKDRENFNTWHEELSQLDVKNKMIKDYAKQMKADINKIE